MSNAWPALPFAEWQDTATTLHMWTQIVGKIRLTLTPWTNHSWHVTLYVTSRGLTTSPIPYGVRTFEITFDFIDHQLHIDTSDGDRRTVELKPRSVADFYAEVMRSLAELGINIRINELPNEFPDAIHFSGDRVHGAGVPERLAHGLHARLGVLRHLLERRALIGAERNGGERVGHVLGGPVHAHIERPGRSRVRGGGRCAFGAGRCAAACADRDGSGGEHEGDGGGTN